MIRLVLCFGILLRSVNGGEIAELSTVYADEYCAKVTEKLTFSHMDDNMISNFVLSPNYLKEILYDTTCPDIWTCFENYRSDLIRVGIRVGFGLIFAVITLIAYVLMAPCGCCRCCRTCRGWCCCRQTRKEGYNMKRKMVMFIWVTTFVLLVGVLIDVIFSIGFLQDLNNGGEAVLCQTFALTDDVLNGNNGTYVDPVTGQYVTHPFIGAKVAQEDVTAIITALEPTSEFSTGVQATLSQTTNLNATVFEFVAWLKFTQSQLGSSIKVADHTCLVCRACCDSSTGGTYIDQLLNVSLPQSYAASVLILRTAIDQYFSTTGVATLTNALTSANRTLVEFTDTFENDIANYLIENKSTIDLVLSLSKWVSIGIVAAIAIPLLVFISSVLFAIFKSNRSSYTDPSIKPMEPCCSWCSWSLWFLYGFLILLIGGSLGLLGYIEGASCETMSNMDEFVNKTYWRLQEESDTLQSSSIQTVIDQCAISTGSGLLLEGIVVEDGVTASDVLLAAAAIIQAMDVAFTETTVSNKFVDDVTFSRLIYSMKHYGNMYMMMADEIEDRITSTSPVTEAGFGGVATCNAVPNFAINGTIGEWIIESMNAAGGNVAANSTSVSLPGASDYYTALTDAGISVGIPGPSCPSDFSQASSTQNPPYGQLMLDKMEVITKSDYLCSSFSFTWDPTTNTGTPSVTPGICNYAQFGTYILDLADTLEAKAAAMDAAAVDAADVIDSNIRTPLNELVVPPLEELTYGLDCQFISSRLNAFYNSLCWAHTPGVIGLCFALFGFGLIAWLGIAAQFTVWRHLRANKDAWKDAVKGGNTSAIEMANVDKTHVDANIGRNNGASSNLSSGPSVVTASAGNRNVVVVQSDA